MYNMELNHIILGRTGVGKSTLINAILGYEAEKTGFGKPITQKGIYKHEVNIHGVQINIYDSWGLEVGKFDEWDTIIDEKLKEKSLYKDMSEWFHSVTYCIQANSDRVEDIDIKIINKFKKEYYEVIVVLTKCDLSNESKEEKLKYIIKREMGLDNKNIISIAAKPQGRGINSINPIGLEDYRKSISNWNKMSEEYFKKMFIYRMPIQIASRLKNDINNTAEKYRNKNFKGDDLKSLSNRISEEFMYYFKKDINRRISKSIEDYCNIVQSMSFINNYSLKSNMNVSINLDDISIKGPEYLLSNLSDMYKDVSSGGEVAAAAIATIVVSPVLIPLTIVSGIIDFFEFLSFDENKKKEATKKFVDELREKFIEEVNKKEFENKIRNSIIEIVSK